MSNLYEVNPTYSRKCTIRGVMPALVVGRLGDTGESQTEYDKRTTNFCPEQRFYVGIDQATWWWPFNKSAQLLCGGWSVGVFSLSILYDEHLSHKNRWSASNCGWDVAKYRGTTLYLQQHKTVDYVFLWDCEYKDINSFLKFENLHPIELVTHPGAILMKSIARSGPRRARKVYIPRPAWWPSGWSNMADIAQTGLFCYFIMAIDLDHPWLGKFQWPDKKETGMWWSDMDWYDKWNELIRNTDKTTSPQERSKARTEATYKAIRGGPFMLRSWKLEHEHYIYPQITIFYKSYWTWGGRTLTMKNVCDPRKPYG